MQNRPLSRKRFHLSAAEVSEAVREAAWEAESEVATVLPAVCDSVHVDDGDCGDLDMS